MDLQLREVSPDRLPRFLLARLSSPGTPKPSAGQLTVTWVDNSTVEAGFSVERSTGSTGTFAEIATTGPAVTSYTDPTVADGTTYCYRVRAYNAADYSDYSNAACGATAQAVASRWRRQARAAAR